MATPTPPDTPSEESPQVLDSPPKPGYADAAPPGPPSPSPPDGQAPPPAPPGDFAAGLATSGLHAPSEDQHARAQRRARARRRNQERAAKLQAPDRRQARREAARRRRQERAQAAQQKDLEAAAYDQALERQEAAATRTTREDHEAIARGDRPKNFRNAEDRVAYETGTPRPTTPQAAQDLVAATNATAEESREAWRVMLKDHMARRGHTQIELANRCEVSDGALYAWTHGKSWPRTDKIPGLIRGLALTPEEANAFTSLYTAGSRKVTSRRLNRLAEVDTIMKIMDHLADQGVIARGAQGDDLRAKVHEAIETVGKKGEG